MVSIVKLKDGSSMPTVTLQTVGARLQSLGAENPRSLIYLVHKCSRTRRLYHDDAFERFLKHRDLVKQDGTIDTDIDRIVTNCIKIHRHQITIELPTCTDKTRT